MFMFDFLIIFKKNEQSKIRGLNGQYIKKILKNNFFLFEFNNSDYNLVFY